MPSIMYVVVADRTLLSSLELDRLLELARSMQFLDGKLSTSIHSSIFVLEGLLTLFEFLVACRHI